MTSTREVPVMWKPLIADGWVNVTGLGVFNPKLKGNPFSCILPLPPTNGQCTVGVGCNNGVAVIYLPDWTVWLRSKFSKTPIKYDRKIFVPASNGEEIDWQHILNRLADPFWNGGYATEVWTHEKLKYFNYPAILEELLLDPEFIELMKTGKVKQRGT